jgi:hypothetical protein
MTQAGHRFLDSILLRFEKRKFIIFDVTLSSFKQASLCATNIALRRWYVGPVFYS